MIGIRILYVFFAMPNGNSLDVLQLDVVLLLSSTGNDSDHERMSEGE